MSEILRSGSETEYTVAGISTLSRCYLTLWVKHSSERRARGAESAAELGWRYRAAERCSV